MSASTIGRASAAVLILMFSGCATVPDVTLSYYRVKWNAQVTVTQTIGCTDTNVPLIANALTVTPTYASDNLHAPFQLKMKSLGGWSADSEMQMTFTDDGRLKSINQSTTGEGEAIVKSAVGLITTLRAPRGDFAPANPCEFIKKVAKDKPLTLTYRATIGPKDLGKRPDLEVSQDSAYYYKNLSDHLVELHVEVGKIANGVSGPSYDPAGEASSVVLLELQKTGFLDVSVTGTKSPLGPVRITVPEDATYKLPIPKAALFGKQAFSLTLSDSGAVVSVGYNKNSGAAGAMNALSAVANTDTPAAKAADLKAQADLIAQQQRLMLCQTQPAQCK